MPVAGAVVALTSEIRGTDSMAKGRSMESLGPAGLDCEGLRRTFHEGFAAQPARPKKQAAFPPAAAPWSD
ncbi:MAG TPA: hypothetical protein IAB01_03690 [Candidatus Avidesulfovibrio excrementigallinarum]|nr:hypothetical protein [Candidatus Avidesulfovibrio excrementigallinarum]